MEIIKTVRTDTYGSTPQFYKDAMRAGRVPNFWGEASINLTDTGELYEFAGADREWWVRKWIPDPSVEDKTDIWKMIIGAKYSDQEAGNLGKKKYSTKKELWEDIKTGKIKWFSTSRREAARKRYLRILDSSENKDETLKDIKITFNLETNISESESDKTPDFVSSKKSYPNYSEIKKQIDLKRQKDEKEETTMSANHKVSNKSEVYIQSSPETVEVDNNQRKKRDIKENKAISIFRRTIGSLLMFISGFSIAALISLSVICGDPTWIAIFFLYVIHLFSIGMADKKQNEWKLTPLIFFPRSQPIKTIYYVLIVISVMSFIVTLEDQSGICSSSF